MKRRVVASGEWCEIACAVIGDGTQSPASTLLDELETNVWPNPNVEIYPDEYQTTQRTRLLALVEAIAEGNDIRRGDFNYLHKGIWELKIQDLRVSFFDTDGEGGWTEKTGSKISAWDGDQWEFPELDELVRLGHCFAKTAPKTNETDLARSIEVREEDAFHDKSSA